MRVRVFLMDTCRLNRDYYNWTIRRWEGRRFYGELAGCLEWESRIRIWENADGDPVGVVHRESAGSVWLQIHPDYRHIEDEMLDWGEANLAIRNKEGRLQVYLDIFDYDTPRQQILIRRGYQKTDDYGYLRWRSIDKPIRDAPRRRLHRALDSSTIRATSSASATSRRRFPHAIYSRASPVQTSFSYRPTIWWPRSTACSAHSPG
jgi:hypothetical protein